MESADIVVIGGGVWSGTKIESESKDASGAFRVITFQRSEDGTWNPTGSLMPLKSLMMAGTYLCNKHTSAAPTQNLSKADSYSPFASKVVRNIECQVNKKQAGDIAGLLFICIFMNLLLNTVESGEIGRLYFLAI